jgi:hypothetical protein
MKKRCLDNAEIIYQEHIETINNLKLSDRTKTELVQQEEKQRSQKCQ